MPSGIDLGLLALVVAWGLWDHFVVWRRFARAVAGGAPNVRPRLYREIAVSEWLLTALVVADWALARRPFATLGLVLPTGVRLVGALAVVALAIALTLVQQRQVAALSPERRARLRQRFAGAATAVLPHTRGELSSFLALSVTAGVCEELLARGFLVAVFGAWIGQWPALLAASLLFGLGHAYQGWRGVVTTALVGLALGAVYLLTRSLLPAIVAHALIDIGSGAVGWHVLREDASA